MYSYVCDYLKDQVFNDQLVYLPPTSGNYVYTWQKWIFFLVFHLSKQQLLRSSMVLLK